MRYKSRMDTPDRSTLTLNLLNDRRTEAVRLRLAGATLREIREATGLSTPTIVAAHRAFVTGGWPAVKVGPRGRTMGEGRRIDAAAEAAFVQLMLTRTPEQLGVDAALWDANAARHVLHLRLAVELGARSMSNYLARWGLAVDKPH
jgi:sulfate adenylyltransferase subunit 2